MKMRTITAVLLALAASTAIASAQDFQIVKVSSVATSTVNELKPKTIFFNDGRADDTTDKGAFTRFDEWSRTKPIQRQFLSLFPKFEEGMVHKVIDGSKKEVPVLPRIDTPIEVEYFRHGGIMPFVLRDLLKAA